MAKKDCKKARPNTREPYVFIAPVTGSPTFSSRDKRYAKIVPAIEKANMVHTRI